MTQLFIFDLDGTLEDYDGFGDEAFWSTLPTETAVVPRLDRIAESIRQFTGGEVRVYAAYRYLSKAGGQSRKGPLPTGGAG